MIDNDQIEILLPLDECTKPRTSKELREWVLAKCDSFAEKPHLREPVLLRQGRFKWFYEEIYPLSLFAVHRYGDRTDVFFLPNGDKSGNFDVEIREPARTFRMEITSAREPLEHIRMEYFVEHRSVPLTGPVTVQGTKRTGHQIGVSLECVDREDSRAEHLGYIKAAATGKAGSGRYGKNYELLIAVEDRWFEADSDTSVIAAFMESEIIALPLQFCRVHVVGLMGQLFLSFSKSTPECSS